MAYNWAEMGRWLRFGVVQGALVLVVGVAVWANTSRVDAKVALTAASLLVGVLLALFGQTYQTGADPWQLFFIWALLILPWVYIVRFELLWLLWLGLLNAALGLYFHTWGGVMNVWFASSEAVFGWLFMLNTIALAVWEWGGKRRNWHVSPWSLRIVALGSGVSITLLMMTYVVDTTPSIASVLVVYPLWLIALYGVYRRWRSDVLLIAGGCVSAISVVTLLLARLLLWEGAWQEGEFNDDRYCGIGDGRRGRRVAEATTPRGFPMTRDADDLKARLSQAGIIINEPTTPVPLGTPWFVRLLQAFSGWLAALFLLGFIAMGMVFLVESPVASLTIGLVMISAAFGLFRKAQSDLLEHLGLAISFAGQLLIAWALAAFWEAFAYPFWSLLGWSLFGLQCALALVMPSQAHRSFSAFAACVALYMALVANAMGPVASGMALLALTALWSNEFRWPTRINHVQAWGYGFWWACWPFRD
ncbi:hypothetical protein HSBAA_12350 [Vreelandella sulfidaeris]|uniref:DUF2157 domain-containing protein n=1 Tax=Vreelandella sulfidaeris TaxID=115553 RepID=A0A455U535_9GAMM|nr:hypothetical protein HSBAA_12350 [Halomonas sulfidaeris]